jgi:hypothetical protein
MKAFWQKIVQLLSVLGSKIVEAPINFLTKFIDFVFSFISKILDIILSGLDAVKVKLSTFGGAVTLIATIFVLVDIYKKDNAGVVSFVITKVIEIITTVAQALQISGSVLIGGAIVILIFLQALKKMEKK